MEPERRLSVGIFHHTLNSVGGGENVCLSIVKALKDRGHRIILATLEKTDWNRVQRAFGETVHVDAERYLFPFSLRAFGIYQRPLTGLLKPLTKCDVTINTHGDVMITSTDIVYLHFPVLAIMRTQTAPYLKYSRPLWKLYFKPYELTQKQLAGRLLHRSLIVTNSNYSRDWIKKTLNREALVVYPPVKIDTFKSVSKSESRRDMVVNVGRYTPEKQQIIMAQLAKELPEVEFHVVGATSKVSPGVISQISQFKNKYGLSNLHLHFNMPFQELLELLSMSKLFLHGYVGEHFGVAIVEAMASGCVPIVPKSGGQWTDIVDYGRYGFGYDRVEEAKEIISSLLSDSDKWRKYHELAVERAENFNGALFKEKMVEIVENYTSKRT
jgi:alpha-1,2-mannosyltransferase